MASRRQATVHRTVASNLSSLAPYKQKSPESAKADSGLLGLVVIMDTIFGGILKTVLRLKIFVPQGVPMILGVSVR